MARLKKCYHPACEKLGLKYTDNELHKIGRNNYCDKHYKIMIKEKNDRLELISKIKELYYITYPTGRMLKQIKTYHDEYGYQYRGMILTLEYASSMHHGTLQERYGLAVIPEYYETVREIYRNKKPVKKLDLVTETVTIDIGSIKPPKKTIKEYRME